MDRQYQRERRQILNGINRVLGTNYTNLGHAFTAAGGAARGVNALGQNLTSAQRRRLSSLEARISGLSGR